ncbi:hypothetical protein [uncultured Modestobacter sp.]|uniref:hypothetical protein n=1 Tax=uncultured Modestobacter sp. TaxID=380048 RepID=UPI00262B13DB|nr:hypothetical protein [uncultured Modestobacter sp.]
MTFGRWLIAALLVAIAVVGLVLQEWPMVMALTAGILLGFAIRAIRRSPRPADPNSSSE